MSLDSSRGANSGSNSKRNHNSASANPSGGSNDRKKKKTSSKKNLGMAWCSNSRSPSRSSFRSSPFSDFGSYMVTKNRKLHEQYDAEASCSSHNGSGSGKPLFSGVSIFVDGYTIPSSQELRGYMLKHGGRFENYFSRHRVTHIVCNNLPDSKIKNLRSFSGGLPVVKPTWVLDSVAANRLLCWVPYQLDRLQSETNNQPKLSAFLALKSKIVSDNAKVCNTGQITLGTEDPSLKCGAIVDANFHEDGEDSEYENQHDAKIDALVGENFTGTVLEDTKCSSANDKERIKELNDVAAFQKGPCILPDLDSCYPSPSIGSVCPDDENLNESSRSTVMCPSRWSHSTLEDPNFVENYFKNSRLHFIGTWRNRYRKRFPSSPDVLGISSLDHASMSKRPTVIHVDMDCFFVSVVIRNNPELRDKPVAVCHSDNPRGTAEISSANYPARDHGVRAGMFVRDAKALCSHLIIFPYDFEAYEAVTDQFYDILHKHCNKVQAVSCDEAFLDVRGIEVEDPQQLASVIRKEIFDATGCTASAGIASNMLMARLATRTAKPDGQCYLPPEKVDDYLEKLPIKRLPGIGYVLEEKLKKMEVTTCGQLRMISKELLRQQFGSKTGDMLWNFSRGTDTRVVGAIQASKSIGAEVNWGVRFKDLKDVKKRKSDAKEPVKYLGCGDCENLSHSITVPLATDDVDVLKRITTQLFGHFNVDVKDIRGMGLQVSKLESAYCNKQGHERSSIHSWLFSASVNATKQHQTHSLAKENADNDIDGNSCQLGLRNDSTNSADLPNFDVCTNFGLPPLVELDMGVIESLPPELFSEVNCMYGGHLSRFILEHRGAKSLGSESVVNIVPSREITSSEGQQGRSEKPQLDHSFAAGTSNPVTSSLTFLNADVMPLSLSQVDASVLQQLPEELRDDILEVLPPHRSGERALNFSLRPHESYLLDSYHPPSEVRPNTDACELNDELWTGNPPQWVEKFKISGSEMLIIFVETYYHLGSTNRLSAILLHAMSKVQLTVSRNTEGWNSDFSCLCKFFRQYFISKIEADIEEIYACVRILKRLCVKSELLLEVYNVILPGLQELVSENYGGYFHV